MKYPAIHRLCQINEKYHTASEPHAFSLMSLKYAMEISVHGLILWLGGNIFAPNRHNPRTAPRVASRFWSRRGRTSRCEGGRNAPEQRGHHDSGLLSWFFAICRRKWYWNCHFCLAFPIVKNTTELNYCGVRAKSWNAPSSVFVVR